MIGNPVVARDYWLMITVMIVEKAMSGKGQLQYLANIALKVNVKLGGINSSVMEPFFRKSRWMLLGGDTSHPSPSQLRMNPPPPTFTALSATWDSSCTAYTSVASAQLSKDQIITDFGTMIKELLERYKKQNGGNSPESILYYRDGLSESQFTAIMAEEVEPLKEACAAMSGIKPKITVVVCIKRHHTRMFPTERGDKLGNVLPGTVIENSTKNDICKPVYASDTHGFPADIIYDRSSSSCWSSGNSPSYPVRNANRPK